MKELLLEFECDITKASFDDANNVSMIYSDKKVYDYDAFQEKYFSIYGSKKPEASVDAVFKNDDDWFFIEFKNGKIDSKESKNIKNKLSPSLLTLLDTIDETLSYARKHIYFILVYNLERNQTYKKVLLNNEVQDSAARNSFKNNIVKLARKEIVFFGLGEYRTVYFKGVRTYNQDQFTNFIQNKVMDRM